MSKEYREGHEGEEDGKPAGTVGQQLAAVIKRQKGGFGSPILSPGRQKDVAPVEEKEREELTLSAAAKRYRDMYKKPTAPPPKKEKALVEKLVDTAKKVITKGIV